MKELITIQKKLKAPKSQFNKFGGYRYRSCEDILEAVKPILAEVGCVLILTDTLSMQGDWHYITAHAKLINSEGAVIETEGHAREEDTKKGMDASQITGSASSYARKYALNGLFCIDDNKDADATNTHGKENTVTYGSLAEVVASGDPIYAPIADAAEKAADKAALREIFKAAKDKLETNTAIAVATKNLIIAKSKKVA